MSMKKLKWRNDRISIKGTSVDESVPYLYTLDLEGASIYSIALVGVDRFLCCRHPGWKLHPSTHKSLIIGYVIRRWC